MNGLHIEKRLYAEKWPVWAILMDGIVCQVCMDKATAQRVIKDMKRGEPK